MSGPESTPTRRLFWLAGVVVAVPVVVGALVLVTTVVIVLGQAWFGGSHDAWLGISPLIFFALLALTIWKVWRG